MANVRCEYCGGYIDETKQTCPHCGATNAAYLRMAHDTPKTISELQSWYRARNLPPESTTRFFIGKNITEPKAFGIYETDGVFVVYKNKANGDRAIRYQGTDEAYAVNEMYLKLKEIILQQKAKNRQQPHREHHTPNTGTWPPSPERYAAFEAQHRASSRRYRRRSAFTGIFTAILLVVIIFGGIAAALHALISKAPPLLNYYYLNEGQLYYVTDPHGGSAGRYEWWKYDAEQHDWALYANTDSDKPFPEELSYMTPSTYALPFSGHPDLSNEIYNIRLCHEFLDLHPQKPIKTNSYYDYDGHIYYFLDDRHGGTYGTSVNRTGWYVYNESSDEWDYFCAYDDKDALGDDLWYNNDAYELTDWSKATWNTSFYDTEFYSDYQKANDSYSEYQSNHSYNDDNDNNWDNDNDWDWDDNDDWDNDDIDWDSDW